MQLDEMHSLIYQALLDRASVVVDKARTVESSNATSDAKDLTRATAVKSLRSILKYLEGDFGIMPIASINKAKELEEKEPQFIAVAEHNQELTKELLFHKERWAKLVKDGVVDENGHPASKKKAKKKKAAPKKATPKPKKAAPKPKPKKPGPPKCKKCGRMFKNGAGLARHEKSCKGKD